MIFSSMNVPFLLLF